MENEWQFQLAQIVWFNFESGAFQSEVTGPMNEVARRCGMIDQWHAARRSDVVAAQMIINQRETGGAAIGIASL